MRALTRWAVMVPTLMALFACASGKKPPPPAQPVKGTVTLDGKRMPDGELIMALPGEAPTILDVKDGAFTGTALMGTNRVEIRAFKNGPPLSTDPEKKPSRQNYLPERFNARSDLTAEVGTGSNEYQFEVKSR